jgi:hypothetical protein
MSNSNANAIRRRTVGVGNAPTPSPNVQTSPSVNAPGLTLPQAISLIDRRLINLESFVKETKDSNQNQVQLQPQTNLSENLNQIVDEFGARFDILARELADLKDVIIKLQSFTMDVNKMLINERIQVFSELNSSSTNTDCEIDQQDTTSVDIRNMVNDECNLEFEASM